MECSICMSVLVGTWSGSKCCCGAEIVKVRTRDIVSSDGRFELRGGMFDESAEVVHSLSFDKY